MKDTLCPTGATYTPTPAAVWNTPSRSTEPLPCVARATSRSPATRCTQPKAHDDRRENFSFDRFTKNGSDVQSTILSPDRSVKDCVVWSINQYLGLNRHPKVIKAAVTAAQNFGTSSGTSSMGGGRSELHLHLEERIAQFLSKESVILYSTGYTANLGALSCLPGPNDLIIADEEVHASIRDVSCSNITSMDVSPS